MPTAMRKKREEGNTTSASSVAIRSENAEGRRLMSAAVRKSDHLSATSLQTKRDIN
jgi:hypothetical protein